MIHLYLLTKPNEKVVEQVSAVGAANRVKVHDSWYDARAGAIQHAIDNGYDRIAFMVGTVELYRRPCGYLPTRATQFDQHGMWLYLDRLTRRYAHVYVPPLAWADRHPGYGEWLVPTIPLVAAYQTAVLAKLSKRDLPLGQLLCHEGYDSYTVGDYFYHNLGTPVLDEQGSAATWRRAYERAITRIVGSEI